MVRGVSEEKKETGKEEKVSIPKPNLEVELPVDEPVVIPSKEEERNGGDDGDDRGGEGAEDGREEEEDEGDEEIEGEQGIPKDEKLWATLVHLSAILGLLMLKMGASQPIVCLLGPLAVWLFKREDMPFVNDQGKEAVNFQIVVAVIGLGFWLIPWAGEYLLRLLLIADVVISLYAATQANQGKRFRYPFIPDTIRILK
jgi:uncharacterized Tic20 family protein